MTLLPFEQIFVDMKTGKYYRARPDDLGHDYHELKLNQVVDLSNHLRRYETDNLNEQGTKLI